MIYANILICGVAIPIYLVMLSSLSAFRKKTMAYTRSFAWILIFASVEAAADLLTVIPVITAVRWAQRLTLILLNSSCSVMAATYALLMYDLCKDRNEEEHTTGRRWFYAAFILNDIHIAVIVILTLTGILYGDSANVQGVSSTVRLMILMFCPMIILFGTIISAIRSPIKRNKKLSIIVFCLIPILIGPLDLIARDIARVPVFLVQIVFLYCNIYTKQKEESAEQKLQLENYRSKLLFSQIEPHFIYNTITGVITLCDIEPKRAKATMFQFSRYLRLHLESMQTDDPVSLSRELEHTEAYLAIEQTRFGENVKVEYDIRATDIFLPPLTLQPLVENAVKHGITMKTEGGTIRISSWDDNLNDYVCVQDDGVGFDTAILEETEHIGLKAARLRLKNMVHGDLTVTSKEGEGTSVLIEIPKEP